ncbi:subtilase-type protease inhibitor [Streptomyces sp. NBC_01795]|uniref:SSI family serine proteinase inhibitor n=1 Tax=Streptomyces sp. NBC_01795 TaxID=2975943 RepID=UPI002DDA0EDB|nr:SSI family serine proteinase inhibitor [Streptomyces sp. NBC_01795]WSA94554.1 subtilase-type protease inhibitor [Streptomyces sp. NBC_01795]
MSWTSRTSRRNRTGVAHCRPGAWSRPAAVGALLLVAGLLAAAGLLAVVGVPSAAGPSAAGPPGAQAPPDPPSAPSSRPGSPSRPGSLAEPAPSAPSVTAPQVLPTRSPLGQGVTATPKGRFRITLHEGHHTSGRVLEEAVLNCFPSTGSTHPRPEEACTVLSRVSGDFAQLPVHNRPCPELDRPVTVVAEGTWRTRPRGFAHTYANRCAAGTESARVFDLSPG